MASDRAGYIRERVRVRATAVASEQGLLEAEEVDQRAPRLARYRGGAERRDVCLPSRRGMALRESSHQI